MNEVARRGGHGWFWFWLLLTILFLGFCVWQHTNNQFAESIPNDVKRRVSAIVADTPLQDKFRINGRDVIFEGEVRQTASLEPLLQRVRQEESTQLVLRDGLTITPGVAAKLQIKSDDTSVTLIGELQKQESADAIVAAANSVWPDKNVDAQITINDQVISQPWIAGMSTFLTPGEDVPDRIDAEGSIIRFSGATGDATKKSAINNRATHAFGNGVSIRNTMDIQPDNNQGMRLPVAADSTEIASQQVAPQGSSQTDTQSEDAHNATNTDTKKDTKKDTKENAEAPAQVVVQVQEVVQEKEVQEVVMGSPNLLANVDDTGSLTLSGKLDSDAAAMEVAAIAKNVFGDAVDNQITVEPQTSPAPWMQELPALMQQMRDVEGAHLQLSGNNLSLSGMVDNQASSDTIAAVVSKLSDRFEVSSDVEFVPLTEPILSLSTAADSVTLSGVLPNADVVNQVVGQITNELTDRDIHNNLQVGDRVSSPEWINKIGALLPALKSLEQGETSITQQGVSVQGIVSEPQMRDAIDSALRDTGIDQIDNTIEVVPMKSAGLFVDMPDGITGTITATGELPDAQTLEVVGNSLQRFADAQDAGANTKIVKQLRVTPRTAEASWADGVKDLLNVYGSVQAGGFEFRDDKIEIRGTVTNEGDRDVILSQASNLVGAANVNDLLIVNVPIGDLIKSLDLTNIRFKYNSDELTAASQQVLNDAVEVLQTSPNVKIEIGGHTDSVGPDAYNLDLSQRRAESVRRYLVGKGLDAGRLEARGYGESTPIASNATQEERAKNRRIEFLVLP